MTTMPNIINMVTARYTSPKLNEKNKVHKVINRIVNLILTFDFNMTKRIKILSTA